MKELEENQRVYERMRDELLISQRSNSDNFDKAILSLSSAGLALTLTFISNLIDLSTAQILFLLYSTWVLFILAIISTLISFLASQKGISKQLDIAEKIYLNNEPVDEKKIKRIASWVNYLNIFSVVVFILALIFLIIFSITNISRGALKMNNQIQTRPTILTEGKPINKLQKKVKIDSTKGLPINKLQPVKPTSSSSTNKNSSNTKK